MSNKQVFVTQPFLPPLEEFTTYLEKRFGTAKY